MKPKQGDIVKVVFLDHCEGGDGDAMEFETFGRISLISKTVIQVTSWGYVNPFLRDAGNETRFDIVRKAITSVDILSYAKQLTT